MSSRIDEYRATYKRMVDEELLELAGQVDQLTEEAQTALREELGRRGIPEGDNAGHDAEAPPGGPPAAADPPEWGMFGAKTPELQPSDLVAVFSAASESEAEQVQEALRDARIESQLQIVILVPQAQAEKAFEVLSEQLGPNAESDDEKEEEAEDEKDR